MSRVGGKTNGIDADASTASVNRTDGWSSGSPSRVQLTPFGDVAQLAALEADRADAQQDPRRGDPLGIDVLLDELPHRLHAEQRTGPHRLAQRVERAVGLGRMAHDLGEHPQHDARLAAGGAVLSRAPAELGGPVGLRPQLLEPRLGEPHVVVGAQPPPDLLDVVDRPPAGRGSSPSASFAAMIDPTELPQRMAGPQPEIVVEEAQHPGLEAALGPAAAHGERDRAARHPAAQVGAGGPDPPDGRGVRRGGGSCGGGVRLGHRRAAA